MFQVSGHNGIEFKQAFTFNQLLVQNRVKTTLCNDITIFFVAFCKEILSVYSIMMHVC